LVILLGSCAYVYVKHQESQVVKKDVVVYELAEQGDPDELHDDEYLDAEIERLEAKAEDNNK
jgi:hypothetical protein